MYYRCRLDVTESRCTSKRAGNRQQFQRKGRKEKTKDSRARNAWKIVQEVTINLLCPFRFLVCKREKSGRVSREKDNRVRRDVKIVGKEKKATRKTLTKARSRVRFFLRDNRIFKIVVVVVVVVVAVVVVIVCIPYVYSSRIGDSYDPERVVNVPWSCHRRVRPRLSSVYLTSGLLVRNTRLSIVIAT